MQKPCRIRSLDGRDVERAMVVFHPAPRSYTGEDLAEISCHGNPLLVDEIMGIIRSTGLARPAENGEFTRRAYINGKIDLAQAEGVGALIHAQSTAGIEMAHSLLDGKLSDTLLKLNSGLLKILSDIEASFIIDEVEAGADSIAQSLTPLIHELDSLLEGAQQASHLYSGIITTIAGLPNAGKSSLFNAVLGYPRAIVHQESGTTRDIIREHLVISGMDFVFHDTAGIRETSSGPEQLGVQKTMEILQRSHLVLYVVDASKGLTPDEEQWLSLGQKTIVVMNKADLVQQDLADTGPPEAICVSAKYGRGIDGLMEAMVRSFPHNQPKVFIERHAYLLGRTRECLANCLKEAEAQMTPDVLAIDLGAAVQYILEITGENIVPDILDRIFSKFCVGK